MHEKLNALGIPHEYDFQTAAGGHSWDYFNHMASRLIDFVCQGLKQAKACLATGLAPVV